MNLKQKLQSGQKIVGTMLRTVRNPAICHLAKNSKLDFIMCDCEHSVYTMETLHDMFVLGNALGLGCYLRVPNGTKEQISLALDCGATGVMVPMVETVEQAQMVVQSAKYQPIGNRGFTAVGAHTAFKGGAAAGIMQEANDTVIVIAQAETKLAVDNADKIAAIEGVDALLIGPNDLSISLGIPGDFMNPIQLEAIATVAAACKKHGKIFGIHAGAPLLEKFWDDIGLVMSMTDTDFLAGGMTDVRKMFDKFCAQ